MQHIVLADIVAEFTSSQFARQTKSGHQITASCDFGQPFEEQGEQHQRRLVIDARPNKEGRYRGKVTVVARIEETITDRDGRKWNRVAIGRDFYITFAAVPVARATAKAVATAFEEAIRGEHGQIEGRPADVAEIVKLAAKHHDTEVR